MHDLFEADYPPDSIGSGSHLAGWGLLAEHEPQHCEPFFYFVDWDDPDPDATGDWRTAAAYGANILTTPHDLGTGCAIPLAVSVQRPAEVQQWDGAAYHRVAEWQATGGATLRRVPYEPEWPYEYWSSGVLFQFADSFVDGQGIQVQESLGLVGPTITSTAPDAGLVGAPLVHTAKGTGDPPFWWSLSEFPTGARIDAETGVVQFTPTRPGPHPFTVVLENDVGSAEQSFVYAVTAPDSGGPDTGDTGDTGVVDTSPSHSATGDSGADSADTGSPTDSEPTDDACGCSAGGGSASLLLLPLLWRRRRSPPECEYPRT